MWSLCAIGKLARAELFFCAATAEMNQKRFDALFTKKDELEKRFGEPFLWDLKNDRKQQYLRSLCPVGGLDQEDKWQLIQEDLVERLVRMENSLRTKKRQLD